MLASRHAGALTTPQAIRRVALEFSKYMPERREGDAIAMVEALARGDKAAAKQQEIQLFLYQLSNNLITDDDDEFIDDHGKDTKIMRMFRDINLPMRVWKEHFVKTIKEPTGMAFIENLLEAAVNTESVDLCEALLESGADPDKIVDSFMTGRRERPVQIAMDCRVLNLDILKLFVRFGADVNLTSPGEPMAALHKAAEKSTVEAVKLLVEAGANIRAHMAHGKAWGSVLTCAAGGESWASSCDDDELEAASPLRTFTTLKYLLPLFDREEDYRYIQSGLIVAASAGRKDLIPLFLEAGADINAAAYQGFTPLLAAATSSYDGSHIAMVRMLIDLGADPNKGRELGPRSNVLRPIHHAAARSDDGLVALLIESGADINARVTISTEHHATTLGSAFESAYRSSGSGRYMAETPLQIALVRNKAGETYWRKGPAAPLALVRAGASLVGGELVGAARFESVELVQELLDRGAEVNATDWTGRTALLTCIDLGHFNLVWTLLQAGAKLCGGELTAAAKGGSKETIEMLLQHGACFDPEDGSEELLLEAAATGRNWDMLCWLIEKEGEGVGEYRPVILCAAVCSDLGMNPNWEKVVEMLIRRRQPDTPVHIYEATAMAYAAAHGQKRLLVRLLQLGVPGTCVLPYGGDRALHYLTSGWRKSLQDAYKKPFWRNCDNLRSSPLTPAIVLKQWKTVRMLLDAGCRPDRLSILVAVELTDIPTWYKEEMTPEDLEAYSAKTFSLVRRLTEIMDFDDINFSAHPITPTPLQAAAHFKARNVVSLLLSRGVDANVPPADNPNPEHMDRSDVMPRYALQAAVESGDAEMIDMLIAAGANVNAPAAYESGATALQIAASTGQIGTARKLISLGADVNADRAVVHGRMALEAAAERGRLDMVQFLLESGAGITGDHERVYYRSIRFARKSGYGAVVKLIEKWKREHYGDDEEDDSDLFYTSEESDDGYYD
ncbi:hypothetical protein jhhlp_005364 [Lomentospora prolificans]|uniref:Uncharacterized protein n=1 Tax=Lomentospora prolificans TaxID=41688 RepID=A0A2N3N6M2_9PEZI|nr:hypothetical protein jhhlp_005364 [Lomentospora prolificans]